MISVEDAQTRIKAAFQPVATETVALAELCGRVTAEDIRAQTDQPPDAVSSMDGYAVRQADGDSARSLIGSAPAGHPFAGTVGPHEAVRIFTGSVIPDGADGVVIQEDVDILGGKIVFTAAAIRPDYIRPAALDFRRGDVLVTAGHIVTARDLALLAAADITSATVRRRPCVAFASIGDELSAPGAPRRPGGIVASSGFGLAAMIAKWGGVPLDLGILADSAAEIATIADAEADILVTLGGASVGDHDLVQHALGARDFQLDFWKVAMRPGKPLIFGRLGVRPLLGMPGNPVSALVCAMLFLKPAIAALLGLAPGTIARGTARLQCDLAANDRREAYIRASLSRNSGELWATPFDVQDSSMLTVLAKADALIVRPPGAPAAKAGSSIEIIPLADL
jgi:molybdopterin molybdotransferase